MPITVKLSLLPEEAEALRDFALAGAVLNAADRVDPAHVTHLRRALLYLHGACAHQIARYVPDGPRSPILREAGQG